MCKVQNNSRIGWIDIVKGITICLVVFNHTSEHLGIEYPCPEIIYSLQMPVFYIVSGMFFKPYTSLKDFAVRKINQLLVPFVFFLFFTSLLPLSLHHHWSVWESLYNFYNHGPAYNWAIWFLLSLFEVFFLFYAITALCGALFCGNLKVRVAAVMVLSFMIGIGGLLLSYNNIKFHLFFDTSMTAMPMFASGWWIKNYTEMIGKVQRLPKLSLLVLWGVTYCLSARLDYSSNAFSTKGLWCGYLCAITGFVTLSLLSVWLKGYRIGRVFDYCGRNTLTILCIHMPLLLVLSVIAKRFSHFGIPYLLLIFIIVMAVCLALVPEAKKFLPHVTNQKPLFH